MRTEARERHPISSAQLWWLRPFVRYSYARDAYVLKAVGRYVGPVLERSDDPPRSSSAKGAR